MKTPVLPTLTDLHGHLATLAGILQIPGQDQRAQTIRRAEKSLVALESFFTPQLVGNVKRWMSANAAIGVLEAKLREAEDREGEVRVCEEQLCVHSHFVQTWDGLSPQDRDNLLAQLQFAQDYQDRQLDKVEAHILHRYRRFVALRPLVPYAENAEHLCEAIFHYENLEKYEANLEQIEDRLARAHERLASVRRGLLLALITCIFVFTLPLCIPFSFSLWSRRREIEKQISNMEEALRREKRRLVCAEEGVVASQAIREILGEVSLEQIRRTLTEVYELRTEFQRPDKLTSATASLMAFFDSRRALLESLFGKIPEDPVDAIHWFVEQMSRARRVECDVRYWEEQLEFLREGQRLALKGYTREILVQSLERLSDERRQMTVLPLPEELHEIFAQVSLSMADLLVAVRKALWHITHAQSVLDLHWRLLQSQVMSQANAVGLVVAALSADAQEPASWSVQEDSSADPDAMVG